MADGDLVKREMAIVCACMRVSWPPHQLVDASSVETDTAEQLVEGE